jgi:hypothetical protein
MKKRHEVLAVLAAAAGLSFAPAAQAKAVSQLEISGQTSAAHEMLQVLQRNLGQTDDRAVSDEALAKMIQLAEARGFGRSGNENAAGSPSKSPQGNGNAEGFGRSGNPNAAGSPDKAPQGSGNAPS